MKTTCAGRILQRRYGDDPGRRHECDSAHTTPPWGPADRLHIDGAYGANNAGLEGGRALVLLCVEPTGPDVGRPDGWRFSNTAIVTNRVPVPYRVGGRNA